MPFRAVQRHFHCHALAVGSVNIRPNLLAQKKEAVLDCYHPTVYVMDYTKVWSHFGGPDVVLLAPGCVQ